MKKQPFRNKPKSAYKKTYKSMVTTGDQRRDTDLLIQEGQENYVLVKKAIQAYFQKFSENDKQLVRPGLHSSSVDADHVYLRSGKVLLAIFEISTEKFLRLTEHRINKYS